MSAERKGHADDSGVNSAATSRETLRRYAAYAIRHSIKFNDGRGNDIEVGPAIVALLDEVESVSKENASLRGYVTTVAAGMSRNDLLAIEKEFTDAEA